jgi:hypothetical protein
MRGVTLILTTIDSYEGKHDTQVAQGVSGNKVKPTKRETRHARILGPKLGGLNYFCFFYIY